MALPPGDLVFGPSALDSLTGRVPILQSRPGVAGALSRVGAWAQLWLSGPHPVFAVCLAASPTQTRATRRPLRLSPSPGRAWAPAKATGRSPQEAWRRPLEGRRPKVRRALRPPRWTCSACEALPEFLKEELHKAQKVGAQRAAGGAAGTRGLSGGAVGSPWAPREIVHLPGPAARRPVLGVREAQKRVLLVTFEGLLEVLTSLKACPKL